MMGHRQVEQAALFYEFSLEKHVPADHLLRSIDRLSTFNRSGGIWHPSIAASVGLRSIRRKSACWPRESRRILQLSGTW
jgi:hypothetical protein